MTVTDILHEIKVYRPPNSNNWQTIPVLAINDESFTFGTCRKTIILRDEDLKPDKKGRVMIDLTQIDLKFFYPAVDVPSEFEMPKEVLEARKERRRLKALSKDAIFIDYTLNPWLYYYAEGDQVRILQGEKEIIVDVELIHGKPAVNVEALEFEYPYLELPAEVARKFKHVLDAKRLQNVSLLPAGKNVLNGKEYFKLSRHIPEHIWRKVEYYFEFFEGQDGDLQGWLTSKPNGVADVLGISQP